MSHLDQVAEADSWRCWLCDEAVDRDMSVNDPRGPSVDAVTTKAKAKSKAKRGAEVRERLAHRGCNTKKGAVTPVVPWPEHLFVVDPAPIIPAVDRLLRKGGREIMARCPTDDDAAEVGTWLVDRITRLEPDLDIQVSTEAGGGQFVVVLHSQR